ncbi:hypothetical protein MHB56_08790 [Paenibacillus sp. FSL H8-0315]|uniref:hypothetical protein n=1 Tax=Paenibacillus sp. FSL H8-0315 TaxID=2921384 RepID=UPI0030FA33E8
MGKLVEEAAGHGEYMWSSLGRVGKLVAGVDGHVEYMWSSLGRVGKLVAGESLLSIMWLLLTI